MVFKLLFEALFVVGMLWVFGTWGKYPELALPLLLVMLGLIHLEDQLQKIRNDISQLDPP